MRANFPSDGRAYASVTGHAGGRPSRPAGRGVEARRQGSGALPRDRPARAVSLPVAIFACSLFIPIIFSIGNLVLNPFRVVLIVTILPCLFKWVSGGAGRWRLADFTLLFYCAWCVISLCVVRGIGQGLQSAGILFVETMGPYLLARCYIRSPDDYRGVTLFLFLIVLLLLPFAFIEGVTGRNILLDLTRSVFTTHPNVYETRWGLRRAHSVVEHPILFGVICGSMFGPVFFALGHARPMIERFGKAAVIVAATFLAMSSGPLSALFAQIMMIVWDKALMRFKARWILLSACLGAGYMLVALVSNQGVFEFFISHFSFSPENAYYRVLIWNFGTGSVMNHPFFGTTMADWDRPAWMPPSIDMFWLFHAIIYGIPAAAAMLATFLAIYVSVALTKIDDEKLAGYRMGFLASLTGFFLVGWTVHFWTVTYALFMFSLGSGAWLLDVGKKEKTEAKTVRRPTRAGRPPASRAGLESRRPLAGPGGRE